MKKTYIVLMLLALLQSSCGYRRTTVSNVGNPAGTQDTFVLAPEITTLHIGDDILPIAYSSQMVESDSCLDLLIRDGATIYVMDVDKDSIGGTISLSKGGSFKNYSGFLYVNPDTLFAYDYNTDNLILFDNEGNMKNAWSTTSGNSMVDPEALNDAPIIYDYPYVILSGAKPGHEIEEYESLLTSIRIDLRTGSVKEGIRFPDMYRKGFFGGIDFNTISHAQLPEGRLAISFRASHNIYIYDREFNMIDSIYAGSRYADKIESADYSPIELFKDKDLRTKYYVFQHSYGALRYDSINGVLYRIAEHPVAEWSETRNVKPFSVIRIALDGSCIEESEVYGPEMKLNTSNMHIYDGALFIQQETDDENLLIYRKFKPLP